MSNDIWRRFEGLTEEQFYDALDTVTTDMRVLLCDKRRLSRAIDELEGRPGGRTVTVPTPMRKAG